MKPDEFQKKVKHTVAHNFNRSYQIYQDFEDKYHLFETLAVELAKHIDLAPRSDVLDVGCGNGISARALHDHFSCRVLGVDLSEKMVAAGQALCHSKDIRLVVGDGERLSSIVGNQIFDYIIYNASIFIFPDAERSIREAVDCLRPGGKIAFSFYPDVVDQNGNDLLLSLFGRLGEPPPKFRVMSDYDKICRSLARHCEDLSHYRHERPLDIGFMRKFFSIPAQSASLFPGRDLEARARLVGSLFSNIEEEASQGSIVWRMAGAKKSAKSF